jgi:hypothetical protein
MKRIGIENKQIIIQNIMKLISKAGGYEKFCKSVGVKGPRLSDWKKYSHRTNLNIFIKICYASDISILDMISTPIREPKFRNPTNVYSCLEQNIVDIELCEKILKNALSRKTIPSLTEVAKEAQTNADFIRNHFPKLSKSIVYRRKINLKRITEIRQQELFKKVREAFFELHCEGIYPSIDNIAKRLGVSYLSVRNGVKDLWLDLLSELGETTSFY